MSDWLPYPWQMASWRQLLTPLEQGKMPHALLLGGEKGSGKAWLLKGFARQLLCEQPGEYPCGVCKSCRLFAAQTHPDFMLLEPDGTFIKVEQIRATIQQLSQTAQMGGRRVVLIAPAEAMNTASSNALLKCLEEPGRDTVIMLLSHSPQRLLPTIRSRCWKLAVDKPGAIEAQQWLQTFVSDPQQCQRLLWLANGNPLQARSYDEEDLLSLYALSLDAMQRVMDGKNWLVLVEPIQQHGGESKKNTPLEKNRAVENWLLIMQKLIWQMIRQTMSSSQAEDMQSFAAVMATDDFVKKAYAMLETVQQALAEVQSGANTNLSLLVESVLIRWQTLIKR